MILGIGCESGTGKDTVCMLLIDYLRSRNMKGLNIVREGFADRLYDLCFAFYSWAGFKSRQHYAMNPKDKELILPLLGKCPRQILIDVSNKLNEYDPDMFLNAIAKNKNFHLKIVPDTRRPWEFDALYNNPDAYLLRITRPGIDSQWEMDVCLKTEPYLSKWHKTICNDGDLACLNQKVKDFADEIVIPRLYNALNRPLPTP